MLFNTACNLVTNTLDSLANRGLSIVVKPIHGGNIYKVVQYVLGLESRKPCYYKSQIIDDASEYAFSGIGKDGKIRRRCLPNVLEAFTNPHDGNRNVSQGRCKSRVDLPLVRGLVDDYKFLGNVTQNVGVHVTERGHAFGNTSL